jgi:hypothetical protein
VLCFKATTFYFVFRSSWDPQKSAYPPLLSACWR